jgi:hypothetical protein
MKLKIDMSLMADVMTAISNYQELGGYFPQLDSSQSESLYKFWNEKVLVLTKSGKIQYMDEQSYSYWNNIDFNVVEQTWSNTSGGWQGIGGEAMTSAYTIIIENKSTEAVFVYYGSKLAYVAYMTEELNRFRENGYYRLPGLKDCSKSLNVIYKNKY